MKRGNRIWIFLLTIICVVNLSCIDVNATEVDQTSAYEILQEQEVYVVAYTQDHAPFSYVEDGEVKGMAVDMMNYIAELAEIQVEYVPLNDVVDASEIDISLSILESDQVEGVSIKSSPYFEFQMMIMGLDNDINYEGASIGHLNYSAITNDLVEEKLIGCEAYTYTSYTELSEALESGEIDYILTSSLVAKQTAALGELLDSNMIQTDFYLDLMLKFNDEMSSDKVEAFNSVISELDTNYKYTIMLNAAIVGASDQMTTYEIIAQYSVQILLGISMLTVILIGVVLYFNINRRKILQRTLNVDSLTGLMTEHYFLETVQEILDKSNDDETFYIISFDMDNFKYINESYGYEKGTAAILAFGENLKSTFSGAECIARPFADSFLICTKIAPKENIICGRDVCVKCIDRCVKDILGSDYKLMTSAGVYKVVDKTLSLAYMVDCANVARRRGKGIYARTEFIFTEKIEEELRETNDIIASMEQALKDKEFKMHYQPKIDFETKKLIGAEALVRWYKPDGTQIYPDQFISLFEKCGFISRLDYYVVNEVCEFIAKHKDVPKVSINISGYSFLEDGLIQKIVEITDYNKVSSSRIEIEITESAIVNEFDVISSKIEELRRLGFTVSMDDFGAGLSSLNRLKDISIDVLKIDKEFLGNGMLNQKGIHILDSIIGMSKKIEITTVAEGVETSGQVKLLTDLHCNVAQGYYYSRPLPEKEFLSFVDGQGKENIDE
ncbi:MAG: EAL domain-containing protein [Eubacteriales bacterium]